MPTFKRLKVRGSSKVHIGFNASDDEGYRTLCGMDIRNKAVSAEKITQYRGDECVRCQKKAEGKGESVGGKPVVGIDWPGAVRYDRGTVLYTPIIPKKSN